MPVENSERRILYLQRKESGYCPRCGSKKRKTYKYTYCEDCRGFFRNYNNEVSQSNNEVRKARYAERKEKNQCPRCGKALGKRYKKTICAICLEKQYNYSYGKKKVKKTVSKKLK